MDVNDFGLFNDYTRKILLLLSLEPYKEFYQREISRISGVSLGLTNKILRNLEKGNIVTKRKSGKNVFYKYNLNNPVSKNIKVLLNLLDIYPLVFKIRKFSKKIIFFGSCASGEDTKKSDIDILIVANEEKNRRRIKSLVRDFEPSTKRKVSPLILPPKEFMEVKIKDKIFYENVMKGIVIWDERKVE